ncbi:MAG: hypothetical protein Q7J98_06505 [Kiritimatiellia bacterium]|nr:hypothetical protein [Kiritimatiellia bacterium]
MPHVTFDFNILIEPTIKNTKHLLDALVDAGLGTASLTTPENILANVDAQPFAPV